MSNIEEMEKTLKTAKEETEGRGAFWCCGVEELFELLVNSLKDLHEENCKLWKEIAELKGKQDFECRGLDDKGNYIYEPNE